MNKKLFFSVLLAVLLLVGVATPTFAERTGSVIGAFGAGITYITALDDTYTAVSVDLEVISRSGLSVSFGSMANFKMGTGTLSVSYFGMGYRYLADTWDIGISMIAIPADTIQDVLLGGKVCGSYWIANGVGLTLNMMFGVGPGTGEAAVSVRPGISVRLY